MCKCLFSLAKSTPVIAALIVLIAAQPAFAKPDPDKKNPKFACIVDWHVALSVFRDGKVDARATFAACKDAAASETDREACAAAYETAGAALEATKDAAELDKDACLLALENEQEE